MITLKCKMCGGDLNLEEGMTVCECEYCSTKQTVPTLDDDKKSKLFDRANRFRMDCQFDKAATVYESIVEEFDSEAEGYWGLLLCKYGIEYVDDPATGDKVPTCHRSSFDSFMEDKDFESVMDYSDSISRNVYRDQAKQIEEIRKGIIEVSGKEEPYDIFICYKETAEDGQRTLDSVLAQDIYESLTDKGYRVFFSRISLEDKLGTEYEPYIFAALNSAKIMLAFGTSYDYYNAVWVKNEWSRYLKLMTKDKSKHLIPCYKDIDAYDIPKEFAKLQAQDLGKVGATQDLIRGIEKIIGSKQNGVVKETVVVQSGTNNNVDAMVKRGHLALEDKEWGKADGFFEEALNQNPECADAYLGKLMAELKVSIIEDLKNCDNPFDDSLNYKKVMRFGTDTKKQILEESNEFIITRINEEKRRKQEKEKRLKEEREAAMKPKYQKALICLGLILNPEQENLIAEENERHEKTLSRLSNELKIAEENAKSDDKLVQIEKEQIESEYNQSLGLLSRSLEESKSSHAEIIRKKENELSSLGIFAVKRKKELSEEIFDIKTLFNKEEGELELKIEQLKSNYQEQLSRMTKRLQDIHKDEDRIKKEIESEKKNNNYTIKRIESVHIDYKIGVQILKDLGDYKDSIELLGKYKLFIASKGDTFTFGKYEWTTLDIQDNKVLAITTNAVDVRPYNNTDCTWSSCSLRRWLNNDFINTAFNSEEKSRIMTTTVSPGGNPKYNTDAGSTTEDRIFLLSIDEVNQYFKSDSERICMYDNRVCWWWLRSPGLDQGRAARVLNDGSVSCYGNHVDGAHSAVRPALWLNLES